MFPLARRVCPAQARWNYLHGISGDEPSLGAKHARVPTGSLHRHRRQGAHVCGLVPGAPLQAASRLRPQGAAQPAPTRTPVPGRAFPAGEPCQRSWNRTLVPSSGEDLRPWWPTARYLPRSTRTSSPPRNSQWPRRPLGSPGSRGWPGEQHPPKPEYEPFADQVREAVAETLADNARYQEQARRLLEGQGGGDVTPASPTISQRGPAVLSYSSAVRAAMGPGCDASLGPAQFSWRLPRPRTPPPPGSMARGQCCLATAASCAQRRPANRLGRTAA
jgi:hypothetical protein